MTNEKGPTMSPITKLAATTAAAALLILSPGAMSVAAVDDGRVEHETAFRHWGLNPDDFPVGSYNSGEAVASAPEAPVPAPAPAPVDPNRMRNDIGLGNLDLRQTIDDPGRARNDIGDVGLSPTSPAVPVSTGMEPEEIVGWAALGVAAASATIAGLIVIRRRHDQSGHLPDAV